MKYVFGVYQCSCGAYIRVARATLDDVLSHWEHDIKKIGEEEVEIEESERGGEVKDDDNDC